MYSLRKLIRVPVWTAKRTIKGIVSKCSQLEYLDLCKHKMGSAHERVNVATCYDARTHGGVRALIEKGTMITSSQCSISKLSGHVDLMGKFNSPWKCLSAPTLPLSFPPFSRFLYDHSISVAASFLFTLFVQLFSTFSPIALHPRVHPLD